MADIEITSGPPNPALDKAFSEFIKERRDKEARRKKERSIPAVRKSVRAVAK